MRIGKDGRGTKYDIGRDSDKCSDRLKRQEIDGDKYVY